MTETLDEILHGPEALPIIVKPDGTYETAAYPPKALTDHAPESISVDWSGDWEMPDVLKEHEQSAIDGMEGGWEIVTGWAGAGTLFIFDAGRTWFGVDLEQHIRDTPGLWAVVSVEIHPPTCTDGEDEMPCSQWTEWERCEHVDYPAESEGIGWALVRRNRSVVLGEDESPIQGQPFWPVLRDGKPTGTHVSQTGRGFVFRAPHDVTPDGFGYRSTHRTTIDDARKDAEEWLTENVA